MQLSTRDQFWLNHVKKWQKSGVAQAQYCRLNNINHKTFSSKKSVFKNNNLLETEDSEQNFIPINTVESFKVKISGGVELTFDKAPDVNWFSKLLTTLEDSHDLH